MIVENFPPSDHAGTSLISDPVKLYPDYNLCMQNNNYHYGAQYSLRWLLRCGQDLIQLSS